MSEQSSSFLTQAVNGSSCHFGYVAADGTILTQGGNWTVNRISTGLYRVTYATPLNTVMAPLLGSAEPYGTRDSITPRFDNVSVNGFDVHTTEGDNGTAANTPRDRDWTFEIPCGDPNGTTIAGPQGPPGADGADGVTPTITPTMREVENSFVIQSTLSTDDIHNNGPTVQFSGNVRIDAGWTRAANVMTYTGSPDRVHGYISINAEDAGVSNYWSRPKLRVLRGLTEIAVIDDLVMQQNGAYDGDATPNGVFVDVNPGANPAYTFEWFDEDARTATLAPNDFSNITLEAKEKFGVIESISVT